MAEESDTKPIRVHNHPKEMRQWQFVISTNSGGSHRRAICHAAVQFLLWANCATRQHAHAQLWRESCFPVHARTVALRCVMPKNGMCLMV